MIRIVIFLLYAVILMILSLPFALLTELFNKHDPGKPAPKTVQWIANHPIPFALKICGTKIDRSGDENILDGPALYVGNHQGMADIFIAISFLGPLKSIMAKKEAAKVPIVHLWMKSFDCIFIDRANPREGLKAIMKAEMLLANGKSVVIFPEGHRSRGPEMGEFKHGAFKAAIKTGVPIVPFAIDDSYQRYDQDHRIHPGTVKLKILPAVDPTGKKSQELADEVKNIIQTQLDEFRKDQP